MSPQFQPHSHSHNYYGSIVHVTRLETTCGSASPPFFCILVALPSTFPYSFLNHTLFSTHPLPCHKPLTHPGDHPKRKQISSLAVIFPSRNPPQKCLKTNLSTMLFVTDKKYNIHKMDKANTFEIQCLTVAI